MPPRGSRGPRLPRACCAGPLLAVVGGLGVVSAVGAVWVPALAVVSVAVVVGVVGVGWGWRRRWRAAACGTDAGVVALGLPAPPPARPDPGGPRAMAGEPPGDVGGRVER
jgi:hypothetical protein